MKKQFIKYVKGFNEPALYFLTFQVNLSKTKVQNGIDRVYAICPVKDKIYIDYFDINGAVYKRCINFSDIDKYITEDEMSLIMLQMKKRMYKISHVDYFDIYESNLLDKLSMCDFSDRDKLDELCLEIQVLLKVESCDNQMIFFNLNLDPNNASKLTPAEKRELLLAYIQYEVENLDIIEIQLTANVTILATNCEDFDTEIEIEDISFSNKELIFSHVSNTTIEEI